MKRLFFTILPWILILFTIWNVGNTIFTHKDSYTTFTYWQNFPSLKTVYLNSQYVNKHPKGWIPDETVNAYAGGEYIKGALPQFIAPDTPPLGRYLIGLSALFFNNSNIIVLFMFVLSLVLMYLLGLQLFHNRTLALLPIALVSAEPLLLNQLVYTPLLDIMQLTFLLAFFFFFNVAIQNKRKVFYYILASFSLGCFISTKFFITGLTMIGAAVFVLLLRKQIKDIVFFLISNSIAIFILLLTYVRSFAFGYSFSRFLGIQKWIFLYHKSQLILPFSIWPLILFNKWYVWFGKDPVISDPQWRITWPIITVLSLVVSLLYVLRKIKKNIGAEILMAWSIIYLLFFSFGQISARYLVILLPVLYIVAVYGMQQLFVAFRKI